MAASAVSTSPPARQADLGAIGIVTPAAEIARFGELSAAGFQPLVVASAAELLPLAAKRQLAAGVVELSGKATGGFELVLKTLAQLRSQYPQVLRVVGVPSGSREFRMRALQFGAQELIHAPLDPRDLTAVLKRRFSAPLRRSLCDLMGSSPPMQRLYD